MLAVLLLAWSFAGVVANEYLPYPSNFNRTTYGLDPGLKFTSSIAQYRSSGAADVDDTEDPSLWSLEFSGAKKLEKNITRSTIQFEFNGTGIDMLIRSQRTVNGYVNADYPGALQVSLEAAVDSRPGDRPGAALSVSYSQELRAWIAKTDQTRLEHKQWLGTITMLEDANYRVERITFLYNIPPEDGFELNMMEISAQAREVSPPLPVTKDNDTWLSNTLGGGQLEDGPQQLNSTTANVIELPPNVTFLSVLGERFWKPGAGGECRFVFDPPLSSGKGLYGTQQNFLHSDNGNPYRVDTVSAGSAGMGTNWTAHLLNQQLDAHTHYKFAIVSGPTNSSGSIIGEAQNATYRSSPNPCSFKKVQLWRYIPDTRHQANATTHSPDATATTGSARRGSDGMGAGAIAGTVVGVVLGVLLLSVLAVWLVRRRRRRRRYFSGDLDDIHDDTKAVPTPPPQITSHTSPTLEDRLPVLVDAETVQRAPTRVPRSRQRQRIFQHEEDAGAVPDDGSSGKAVGFVGQPPLYGEDSYHQRTHREQPSEGQSATDSRGMSAASCQSPDFTAEEIKYLGHPLTPSGMEQQRVLQPPPRPASVRLPSQEKDQGVMDS